MGVTGCLFFCVSLRRPSADDVRIQCATLLSTLLRNVDVARRRQRKKEKKVTFDHHSLTHFDISVAYDCC